MDYREARVYLDEAAKYGSVLGLDNMRELLGRLGNPQDELKFIHISGTNGKGSVLAYLSTILMEAGYRVGRYISPTLFSYRERIQVNEEFIRRESLAVHVSRIRETIEQMQKEGLPHPTVFEIETALSFLYFAEERCDIVVLETGMGGLTDATNIIRTTVMEVLVKISMDHMQFLGNTLSEIAAQKAGIIKPHTVAVSTRQEPEAMQVIEAQVEKTGSVLFVADPADAADIHYGLERQSFSYDGLEHLEISLAGSYQIANAVTAVTAVRALRTLGYEISEEQLRRGLRRTQWRGRFTVLCRHPLIVMDGAHNPDGALQLKNSIEQYFKGRRIFYICGMFRDKDYETVLRTVSPYSDTIFTIQTPGNPRALPAEELAKAARPYFAQVKAERTIAEALEDALRQAQQEEDVILAFGSLSFLGEFSGAVEKIKEIGQ
ncbi:MAG: folylpolyglutamate synthase/dihydrofolate synthase family protein [Eubacteriales bacterium]|nr:folylpolyglutamate synthase/dihydrofolate synthase family protein [Eubacteriales bacterium]